MALQAQVNCPEVIVDTSALNESRLVPAHQAIKNASEPVRHALCDQLAKAVDKAYGPKVPDLFRVIFLRSTIYASFR